jgi:hypothetical protein
MVEDGGSCSFLYSWSLGATRTDCLTSFWADYLSPCLCDDHSSQLPSISSQARALLSNSNVWSSSNVWSHSNAWSNSEGWSNPKWNDHGASADGRRDRWGWVSVSSIFQEPVSLPQQFFFFLSSQLPFNAALRRSARKPVPKRFGTPLLSERIIKRPRQSPVLQSTSPVKTYSNPKNSPTVKGSWKFFFLSYNLFLE